MSKTAHSITKSLRFKKSTAVFVALVTAAAGVYIIITAQASSTTATCSQLTTDHGVAEQTVEVPQDGVYRIWNRIMAPEQTNGSFYLGVGSDDCDLISDANITPGEWTWIDYRGGDTNDKLEKSLEAGVHQVQMIGVEDGVKLDNLVLTTDLECVPEGTGENCLEDAAEEEPEPEPLSAPNNLEAVAVSHNQIDLTWEGDSPYYYLIYRDDALIAAHESGQGNSYSDTSVSPSTTYSYYVTAIDENDNESDPSNTVTVTTPEKEDTEAPTEPSGLQADAASHDQVELNWNASTDNVGVTGYMVYRDGAVVKDLAASQTNWTDTGVSAEVTYSYYVRAYDEADNLSEPSEDATVTTPAAPSEPEEELVDPPTDLKASVPGKKQVNLSWSASSGAVSYQVYRDDKLIGTTSSTDFGDGTVKPNRSYSYHVVAVSSTGYTSDPSETVTADTSNPDDGDDDNSGKGWGKGGKQ